jgi:hypothetical protein
MTIDDMKIMNSAGYCDFIKTELDSIDISLCPILKDGVLEKGLKSAIANYLLKLNSLQNKMSQGMTLEERKAELLSEDM